MGPQVPLVIDSLPSPGMAERLTRVTARDDVDRLDLRPVDGCHVAQVGHIGPVVGEDLGRGFIPLTEPGRPGTGKHSLDSHIEAPVSSEQRTYLHAVTSALRLFTAAWIRLSKPCAWASPQIDRNSASDWAAATRSSNSATAGLIISSRVTFRFPA